MVNRGDHTVRNWVEDPERMPPSRHGSHSQLEPEENRHSDEEIKKVMSPEEEEEEKG